MTIGMIVGLILLPLAWVLLAAANKAHRAETGVDGPTRNAMRNIRRNARRKGISEQQAYMEWLQRQQHRRSPSLALPPAVFSYYASPPRPKAPQTAEELAQNEADAPLKAYATARNLRLYRQFNGAYYFINLESGGTLVRNPGDPSTYDFAREEVIRYLGQMPERPTLP